jgi:hypothetical protein
VPIEKSSSSKSSSSKSSSSKSSSSSSRSSKHSSSSRRESRRESAQLAVDIPKGRPLSVSKIQSPKPVAPHATKYILEADYSAPSVEELTRRFGSTSVNDYGYDYDYELPSSPASSVGSTISSSSGMSSPSSASSISDYSSPAGSDCTCERYGITRRGDRIKLDCGGSRCGYSEDDSSCCSDEDAEYQARSSRRDGIVVRR